MPSSAVLGHGNTGEGASAARVGGLLFGEGGRQDKRESEEAAGMGSSPGC